MDIGQNKTVSTFWNAVVASVIMVATALVLKGDASQETIIIFQGVLFGVKTGSDMLHNYTTAKVNEAEARIRYEKL